MLVASCRTLPYLRASDTPLDRLVIVLSCESVEVGIRLLELKVDPVHLEIRTEGNWDLLRPHYCTSSTSFHELLASFTRVKTCRFQRYSLYNQQTLDIVLGQWSLDALDVINADIDVRTYVHASRGKIKSIPTVRMVNVMWTHGGHAAALAQAMEFQNNVKELTITDSPFTGLLRHGFAGIGELPALRAVHLGSHARHTGLVEEQKFRDMVQFLSDRCPALEELKLTAIRMEVRLGETTPYVASVFGRLRSVVMDTVDMSPGLCEAIVESENAGTLRTVRMFNSFRFVGCTYEQCYGANRYRELVARRPDIYDTDEVFASPIMMVLLLHLLRHRGVRNLGFDATWNFRQPLHWRRHRRNLKEIEECISLVHTLDIDEAVLAEIYQHHIEPPTPNRVRNLCLRPSASRHVGPSDLLGVLYHFKDAATLNFNGIENENDRSLLALMKFVPFTHAHTMEIAQRMLWIRVDPLQDNFAHLCSLRIRMPSTSRGMTNHMLGPLLSEESRDMSLREFSVTASGRSENERFRGTQQEKGEVTNILNNIRQITKLHPRISVIGIPHVVWFEEALRENSVYLCTCDTAVVVEMEMPFVVATT